MAETICCPICKSSQIYTIDNIALDNRSADRGKPELDMEIYAEAKCYMCEEVFSIQGTITWQQPLPRT